MARNEDGCKRKDSQVWTRGVRDGLGGRNWCGWKVGVKDMGGCEDNGGLRSKEQTSCMSGDMWAAKSFPPPLYPSH